MNILKNINLFIILILISGCSLVPLPPLKIQDFRNCVERMIKAGTSGNEASAICHVR